MNVPSLLISLRTAKNGKTADLETRETLVRRVCKKFVMDLCYVPLRLPCRYECFKSVNMPKEAVDRLHFIMVKSLLVGNT